MASLVKTSVPDCGGEVGRMLVDDLDVELTQDGAATRSIN